MDDVQATAVEAAAAKDAGIRMFAIGLTDMIDGDELKSIASRPLTEHYYKRTSIKLAQTITSQLLWSVCHARCTTTACARNFTGGRSRFCLLFAPNFPLLILSRALVANSI